MVAGPGLSALAGDGHRKQTLCVSMWPCLCAMNVRGGGGRSFPGHSNQVSWNTVREVRCSGFLESSYQRLQFGKELSVLPPTHVPEGAPFPCHLTAARGYRQHERMPCRDTQTASLWLFLGTRRSITALAQPEVWAKLACLLMRLIQLGGEQYLEAVLLVALDLLTPTVSAQHCILLRGMLIRNDSTSEVSTGTGG